MGSPPPPDLPSPEEEAAAAAEAVPEVPSAVVDFALCPSIDVDIPDVPNLLPAGVGAGFSASPSGFALCGFQVPPSFTINLGFSFALPDFSLPIPNLFFGLCLSCDLSDPLDAEFGFGGGRVGTDDLEVDPEFGSV